MSKTTFPILYKYTSKGQAQQWQIIAEDDHFYTIEGIVDGKLTISMPTYCQGKNIGKKNETTAQDQAILEAKAKHQKKLDANYNEELTDEKKFLEPMLAFEYGKYPIDWEKVGSGQIHIYGQPKLDGLRAINQKNKLDSRNGKPYVSTPHLLQDQFCLDGELYTHIFKDDFNKIVSLCKKQKPIDEEIAESAEMVQFWAYDMPFVEGGFSARYRALQTAVAELNNPMIVVTPTVKLHSLEELQEFHAKNLSDGFEGTIIRIDGVDYENKRSKSLLKFKDFKDEEFKIVGYEEGTGNRVGTIGFFIMQHDKDPNLTFKSNVKGNFDYLKDIWQHRQEYVGKTATVKYFQRTPKKEDGTGDVPRFPYIIKIDRESYE